MSLLTQIEGSQRKVLEYSGGCHNCPRKRVDFVPATLRATKIIFVGEAPGETETETGEGFTGKSGQLLRSVAQQYGIYDYSLTNVIHCRPPQNATPQSKEIACCMSQLTMSEVRGYPIVVLLGHVALSAFFPTPGGTKSIRYLGNVAHHPDYPGQRFYAMQHPSALLHNPNKKPEFEKYMERLSRIVAGEPPPTYKVWRGTANGAWEVFQRIMQANLISYDAETSHLETWKPGSHIKSLAVCADETDVYYAHMDDPHWLMVLEALGRYLADPTKHVVGHSLAFDLGWAEEECGIQVMCTGKHDTQIIWHEAKQYKSASLKELTSQELDGYRFLVYNPSTETDTMLLGNYNAEDVINPLKLFKLGLARLKPKTRDLVTRVTSPVSHVVQKITRKGMYFRRDYQKVKLREYDEKKNRILEAWRDEDRTFIPTVHDSGNGLMEYLFGIHKLPIVGRTETNEASTDKYAIKEWIRQGYTFLHHLQELREVEKIRSSLVSYDKNVGADSRVHSNYTLTYVDSGRSSSRNPNMQNPHRLKDIRDLFGVPEGSVLLQGDLNQIELRIMMALSNDLNGINAYLSGQDLHGKTAGAFAKPGIIPTPEQLKEFRTWAKVINFALCYGGDAYKVQDWALNQYGLAWTIEQAQAFVDAFFGLYWRLKQYHGEQAALLMDNRGWFESITGHIFHYWDWNSPDQGKRDHAFRSQLNSCAQGPAAQICFLIMVHADRLFIERGLPAFIVNTVHDSMMVEVSDPKCVSPVVEAIEDARAIAYEWIKPWFAGIPLVMEYETGPAWGSLDKYKLGKAA